MGKTSIARELGRRLATEEWTFLFADVEGAKCAEDVIAEIAKVAYQVRGILPRFVAAMKHWFEDHVEELNASQFGIKIRGGLNEGNWRRHGEILLRECADHDSPVLLVVDELPIFLRRMLNADGNKRRVDEFLSWLRGALQNCSNDSLVLIVSGSIGLQPLVNQLGIPDRISHLHPFRLGPWTRQTSVECFESLSKSANLNVENGVAVAVYDKLGLGIPYHIQSFFVRLHDFATLQHQDRIRVSDVEAVYHNELLGPSGQNDLAHYETRLKDSLDDESYAIAMEVLAEAATQDGLTPDARRHFERVYSKSMEEPSRHLQHVIDILLHDGYFESADKNGYRFASRLLKDWWLRRHGDSYIPIHRRSFAAADE